MQQTFQETLDSTWQAAWDHGDVGALASIVTPEYVRVSRSSGNSSTLADLQGEITAIRSGFPDLVTTIDAVVVEGDQAAIFWTSTGTHTENFLGVPPTNRRVQTRGCNHANLVGGRIAREEVTWDGSELLHSLGVRHLSDTPSTPPEVTVEDFSGDPDPQVMKTFNRQFITGVTVVTTQDGDTPRGLAVNSYASVSLEPPLVMVCIQKTSSTYPALFAATHLGINILGTNQRETIATFASKTPDKFAEVDWHAAPNGSPLIDGSPASLEAEIRERFQAKTHTVFICRVRHAEVVEASPIIYKAGRFYDSDDLTQL
ncbi:flavin reductase [Arthrobacter sp. RIT-PI-e]|uniref:flavin reductase n=1 Tax=Arthrobacter sp. RIT-PI-e TaxID=1681197 RepID=UPI000676218C|nr:flavin reductase [Arthrobacter sp. RIT-PI-e]KNC20115.1 flavin reductase [Arthrobacter sp. RIT-PI-e]